jgi:tetratricopeptide (TPR) repeat protein
VRGGADFRAPEFEMKPSRRITITASILLVTCLTGSVFLLRRLDRERTGATLQEVLYISSPTLLKRMSLGYDGLLADVYWTRAVQYFGDQLTRGSEHFDLLAPLLEITTTLDPHLLVAYEYGANFLAPKIPGGAGEPERAIKLTEFGIRNNPGQWHLYYDLGFIYYLELNDYANAEKAFADGAKLPHSHQVMPIMAAKMAEHAGSIETARLMWVTTYQTTHDRSVKSNAVAHLNALQVDQDVTTLETLVSRYREKNGHLPESFSDLLAANMLGTIPVDPLGHTYKLMPDGQVEVRVPDDLPFIEKGTPIGYIAPRVPKLPPVN